MDMFFKRNAVSWVEGLPRPNGVHRPVGLGNQNAHPWVPSVYWKMECADSCVKSRRVGSTGFLVPRHDPNAQS